MKNAKLEFLDLVTKARAQGADLLGAKIAYDDLTVFLYPDYSDSDYQQFLHNLDFTYQDETDVYNAHSPQILYGTVWFTNDVWAERIIVCNTEMWQLRICPMMDFWWD